MDAPLLFYKEFRKCLEQEEGFEAHPLDNCLFLLRNPADPTKLDGILGTHVDDGIGGGGGGPRFNRALENLQKKLPFRNREYRKFEFTGLTIEQRQDYSIRVGQKDYVHQIDPIDVAKVRRKELESPVSSQEQHQLRALCGSRPLTSRHDGKSRVSSETDMQCKGQGPLGSKQSVTRNKGECRNFHFGSANRYAASYFCQLWGCKLCIRVTTQAAARGVHCSMHKRTCNQPNIGNITYLMAFQTN